MIRAKASKKLEEEIRKELEIQDPPKEIARAILYAASDDAARSGVVSE